MKPPSRFRPRLELLEDRVCPVLSVGRSGTLLVISGAPVDAGGAGVVVTETSQGIFRVKDGTALKGSFPASSIYMNFSTRANVPVTLNLGGFVLAGSVSINAGVGLQKSPGTMGVGIENGIIDGNVTYVGGSGNENLYLGLDFQGHNPMDGANKNLVIKGNVLFTPRVGNKPLINEANELLTSYPDTSGGQTSCAIGGNVTTTNTEVVTFSNTSSVGGYVSVSSGSLTTQEFLDIDGTVGKYVVANGGVGGLDLEIGETAGRERPLRGR